MTVRKIERRRGRRSGALADQASYLRVLWKLALEREGEGEIRIDRVEGMGFHGD